jgi:hypothetical protein
MRLAIFLTLAIGSFAAERLKLEYFHDEDRSTLVLRDLAFADAERGMAVGAMEFSNGEIKGAGLATTDGGKSWTPIRLPEPAFWLFLDARAAWFGDGSRTFRSTDFGKNWKRVGDLNDILHVFFLDERRGWAAGLRKTVLETSDGGENWKRMPASDQPNTRKETTRYSWIAFAGDTFGVITGSTRAPRRQPFQLPEWMDPESRPREWPAVTVVLQTLDSGKTWQASEVSLFGQISRVRLGENGAGLALVEFRGEFPYPAEVYRMDFRTGGSPRVFRKEDRAVTDVAVRGTNSWLVAVEPTGKVFRMPVPGKLKLLQSDNLVDWTEIPVDYRAVAGRAVFAWAGDTLWVATDTGMLLSLR